MIEDLKGILADKEGIIVHYVGKVDRLNHTIQELNTKIGKLASEKYFNSFFD